MHACPHLVSAVLILVVLAAFWSRTPVQPLASTDQPFYLSIACDLLHPHRFTDGDRFSGGGARCGRAVGTMAAGALLLVMPWIVRNAVVLHRASLTCGYASRTLVQRLAFDGMTWHEYG